MPPDNSQYPDACLIRLGKFPTGLAGVGATAVHAAGTAALIGLYEHHNATKNGVDSPYSDSPDAVPQQGPQYQYNVSSLIAVYDMVCAGGSSFNVVTDSLGGVPQW
ncbi:hypothetical protein BC835DRAFT_1308595 [Cytidiella melzeri]|nr:hypothetical protein BC835DRAFT_1308595 [Cytidiella melzeri]